MNATDPQDATPLDAVAGQGAEPRRWTSSGVRNRCELAFWVCFVVVAAVITVPFVRAGGVTVGFVALWWAMVVAIGARQVRTATRVELYADGSLLMIAPTRVVHAHVTRVLGLREAARWNDRGQWSEPDVVLETADGAMRLPRRLVTEDLVDVLRTGSPDMAIPYFRGRR